jgi:hypothetical protein
MKKKIQTAVVILFIELISATHRDSMWYFYYISFLNMNPLSTRVGNGGLMMLVEEMGRNHG